MTRAHGSEEETKTYERHQVDFAEEKEYEADEAGWELCTDAGIDPRGMISFFRKLLRLHGGSGASSWDSTHPGTADRIVALEEKWRQVPAGARRNLGAA